MFLYRVRKKGGGNGNGCALEFMEGQYGPLLSRAWSFLCLAPVGGYRDDSDADRVCAVHERSERREGWLRLWYQ